MEKTVETSCTSEDAVDPRVRRTRKLLQDSLRSLLQEKPLVGISVADIAQRATVNRATFYAHYPDKQSLAAACLKSDLHDAVFGHFTQRVPLTHESLVEMAEVIFDFLGTLHGSCPKSAAELQDTFGTLLQEELYTIMVGWLSHKSDWVRLFPGCSKENVGTVLSWAIYGGAHRWSRIPNRGPARAACREVVSVLLPPTKTS